MKKAMMMLVMFTFLFMCTPFKCTHIHTEECGKNFENCTHQCFIVEPKRDENPKL